MQMSTETELAFEFERFRLFPSRQLLMESGNVCPLGSRAIEILVCLLERPGQMVTKQELLERAWPDTFVHEANLRVNVSGLRKALGDGQGGRRFIVNLTGQGYCFVGPVRRLEATVPQLPPPSENRAKHNLPLQMSRSLGRESDVEAIALQLPMRRCVTVAGPGGIGKTTVALAVAERLLPVYDDGVWFVDLSAVADGQLILPSVAQVLGVSLHSRNALSSLVTYLRNKRLLLLLDNCEHVIDDAAKLAESILLETREVSVLATSRETLRVSREWVHWLAPLAMPPAATALTAAEALSFAAIRFFVDCAAISLEGFTLQDADVPVAVTICRGLDGLPLAIELAAARIDILGLPGLAKVLNEPFLLWSEGRRGALPRQQNLMRMLEWSYRLLSPVERAILRRLSVFRGEFSLEGALEIAGGDGIEPEDVYSGVLTLSAKSLITNDIYAGTPNPHHRMLHVTRTLLSHKLRETAESAIVQRRHAQFIRALLAKAETDWDELTRPAWLEIYARSIEDVRAAIDWTFSAEGDASLGVVLTAMALPLGFQLSLIEEFRGRVERALLHSQRIRPPQPLAEMRLNCALGMLTHNIKGPSGGRTAALERAIEAGRRLDQPAYQVEPLIGLATAHLGACDHLLAIEVSTQAIGMGQSAGLPMAVLAAERILAQAHHFNGDHAAAAQFAHRVIDHPVSRLPLAYNLTPVDRRVSMQIVLARIFWIQGKLDAADRVLTDTMEVARQDGPFSYCPTLAFSAIPIAIWNGDSARAAALIALLAEQAKRYTLGYWQQWADAFDIALRLRAGEPDCVPILSDSLQFETFATFSPQFLTPEAASRAAGGNSGWCYPEILRAQGEWLLAQRGTGGTAEAEALFREALEVARRQGALSWELRAAASLGRLWKADGKSRAAHDLIADVLGRCEQHRRSADLIEAAVLLDNAQRENPIVRTLQERPVRRRASHRAGASRRRL
jgi:predicted ATPase/DNA-binding winged helix-turn-helix (wHTH) protein